MSGSGVGSSIPGRAPSGEATVSEVYDARPCPRPSPHAGRDRPTTRRRPRPRRGAVHQVSGTWFPAAIAAAAVTLTYRSVYARCAAVSARCRPRRDQLADPTHLTEPSMTRAPNSLPCGPIATHRSHPQLPPPPTVVRGTSDLSFQEHPCRSGGDRGIRFGRRRDLRRHPTHPFEQHLLGQQRHLDVLLDDEKPDDARWAGR